MDPLLQVWRPAICICAPSPEGHGFSLVLYLFARAKSMDDEVPYIHLYWRRIMFGVALFFAMLIPLILYRENSAWLCVGFSAGLLLAFSRRVTHNRHVLLWSPFLRELHKHRNRLISGTGSETEIAKEINIPHRLPELSDLPLFPSLPHKVFISYARGSKKGRQIARDLYQAFTEKNIPAIYDQEGLEEGANWKHLLWSYLRSCTVFIGVVDPRTVIRPYCILELASALDRRSKTGYPRIAIIKALAGSDNEEYDFTKKGSHLFGDIISRYKFDNPQVHPKTIPYGDKTCDIVSSSLPCSETFTFIPHDFFIDNWPKWKSYLQSLGALKPIGLVLATVLALILLWGLSVNPDLLSRIIGWDYQPLLVATSSFMAGLFLRHFYAHLAPMTKGFFRWPLQLVHLAAMGSFIASIVLLGQGASALQIAVLVVAAGFGLAFASLNLYASGGHLHPDFLDHLRASAAGINSKKKGNEEVE